MMVSHTETQHVVWMLFHPEPPHVAGAGCAWCDDARARAAARAAPPLCDVCGSPTHGEERLLPGESGGRIAHQLCYWRQRALAGESKR